MVSEIEEETARLKLELERLQTSIDEQTQALAQATAAPTAPPPAPEAPSAPLVPFSEIPTYTGYTFWSSDFHISPIADLKDIFLPMGHSIIDKSLSGHCKLKDPPTCQIDLRVLNTNDGLDMGIKNKGPNKGRACPNRMKREFFDSYKADPEMVNVDAFLCNHAIGECEIFMGFGRPLVAIASTRYEIGRYNAPEWRAWNQNLRDIAANPRNVVAANNRYDAEYIK